MRYVLSLALAFLLLLPAACGSPTAPKLPDGAVRVTGTVHYYTFEGGFWAIRGDDAVNYDPLNSLPAAFQRENLRVTMVVKIRDDLVSIHMSGPIVEILEIRVI